MSGMSKRRFEPTGEELTQRRYVGPQLGMDVRMMDRRYYVPRRFVPQQKKYYSRRKYGRQNALVKALDIEKKFFDTNISFNIDATGEVPATGQLNLIPQGATDSTRVGRKCTLRSIQARILMQYVPGADTIGCTTTYVYCVLDTQANGAAAAATDVLTGTNFALAMINLANSERFRILKKWIFKFQAAAGVQAAFGRDEQNIEWYKKLNLPLEFSSTTGAITEIKSNNIFLLAGSDTSTDDEVVCSGTVRVRFTDL